MSASPNFEFGADVLRDENRSLKLEWLVTNGLGGYACGTLAGANTRRYHGLLVAALQPPVSRAVLLSKLEETAEVEAGGTAITCALSDNLYPGVTYPQGHRILESWTAYPAPTWVWTVAPSVRIEKSVFMAPGKNTTYVAYRLLEAPDDVSVRMHLVPLLAWKDYHREMRASDVAAQAYWFAPSPMDDREATYARSMLEIKLPEIQQIAPGPIPLRLSALTMDGAPHPEAKYSERPCWYYRFQHPREAERGFDCEEDLYSVGMLTAPLAVGETLVITASAEEGPPSAPDAALAAIRTRQGEALTASGQTDTFGQKLALAAGAFVAQAPGGRATLIAGYPWFADWGRDTMIALPGICLATGRTEIAREILLSYAQYLSRGMLPNRFPDQGVAPEYNTVDATLWYFAALYRYVEHTGDLALVADHLWPALEEIALNHQRGTRYNIREEPSDHLLYAGQPGVQLTWMDARVGDHVVTPRIGKPVEISALWHNALRTLSYFAQRLGQADAAARYSVMATLTQQAFKARFPQADDRGLYDVLDTPDGNRPDPAIRPNQLFAVSLPFAPVEAADPLARTILDLIQTELWTPYGLRTLSPGDPAYAARYEGDGWQRDNAYHQGTVWPWLLGPYAEARFKVFGDRAAAQELLRPLESQLETYCIGQLAEIYDGSAPQRPNGCFAQAWSVGETLRVWKRLQG